MTFNAYTQDLYLDDVRLSNALTVEHNTMGPGVVGHILRVTQTDPTTYARADRWLHYDQVGSVLSESDATGNFIQRHEQDTFGNTLASWQTGLIGGDRTGWHHNTKEWDADIGLSYGGMRWLNPVTGTFISQSPLAPLREHQYVFAVNNPIFYFDANGLLEGLGGIPPQAAGDFGGIPPTACPTSTPAPSPSPSPSPVPTACFTPDPTATPFPTEIFTPTPSPTDTPIWPTSSPSLTPTPSRTPVSNKDKANALGWVGLGYGIAGVVVGIAALPLSGPAALGLGIMAAGYGVASAAATAGSLYYGTRPDPTCSTCNH
jgi:RHS repeat-associated protein